MVERKTETDTVTLTVPGDVMARLQDADLAESTALHAAAVEFTAGNNRALATARRELADAYDGLADQFREFIGLLPLSVALRMYADRLRAKASANADTAERLEARADEARHEPDGGQ